MSLNLVLRPKYMYIYIYKPFCSGMKFFPRRGCSSLLPVCVCGGGTYISESLYVCIYIYIHTNIYIYQIYISKYKSGVGGTYMGGLHIYQNLFRYISEFLFLLIISVSFLYISQNLFRSSMVLS